jgi:hypothetical protein
VRQLYDEEWVFLSTLREVKLEPATPESGG